MNGMGCVRVRAIVLFACGALFAPGLAARPARAGGDSKTLKDFLPARLGDAERAPPGLSALFMNRRASGSYKVKDDSGGAPRDVDITFVVGPDEAELSKALTVQKVGETRPAAPGGIAEGLRVDGRFVQRICFVPDMQCFVDVVLAKRQLLVQLVIERATDKDEPLRLLKMVDLKGVEAFVRKHGPAIVAAGPQTAESAMQDFAGAVPVRAGSTGGLRASSPERVEKRPKTK